LSEIFDVENNAQQNGQQSQNQGIVGLPLALLQIVEIPQWVHAITQTIQSTADALNRAFSQLGIDNLFTLDFGILQEVETTVAVTNNLATVVTEQPPSCADEDSCDWLCENFIRNGLIQTFELAVGGPSIDQIDLTSFVQSNSDNGRLL